METEKKIYFEEKQRFTNPFLYISIASILLTPIIVYISSGETKVFQNNFLVSIIVSLLIFIVSYITQLETRIDQDGIHYRFFPFKRKFTSFPSEKIKEVSVRTYKPIREFGGWGLRYSFKNGKAVNVKGKEGIQLLLNNGDKLLIGTQSSKKAQEGIQLFLSEKK